MQTALAESGAPALVVSVWQGDAIVWSEAFGMADLEHQVPATRASKFRLGSVSKVLTAILAARLADAGEVDLDADIRQALPAFPDKGAPITLRQLLGHLAGIRHYQRKDFDFSVPGGMIDTRPYASDQEIYSLFFDDPLVSRPGAAFNYSTFGYTLVGAVLEATTGRSFYDLLDTYVLAPAGASETVIDDRFAIIPDRVDFYDPTSDYEGYLSRQLGPVVNAWPLNSAYKRPGGGLIGTADDMVRIAALLFEPGFLSQAMYTQMFTSQTDASGKLTGTGLGWRVGKDAQGRTIYQHRGTQQGNRSFVIIFPDEHMAVAILSNLRARPANIEKVAGQIAGVFRQN